MPFFRKKKKRVLPKPPSLGIDASSSIQGPTTQSGFIKPPEPKEYREVKETITPPPFHTYSKPLGEIQGPPREQTPKFQEPHTEQTSQTQGSPQDIGQIFQEELNKYSGPPKAAELQKGSHSGLLNLPAPPPLGEQGALTPPGTAGSLSNAPTPIFGSEEASEDILSELKSKSFGSGLAKAPEHRFERKSVDELTHRHFQETRQSYIDAGNKHLELNFYDNAAINFGCAIFCDLISGGIEAARRSINDLSSGMPSGVIENTIYDSVRLVIEATRTRNFTFLNRAERILQNNLGKLYPEDAAIIERGLAVAKSHFGM